VRVRERHPEGVVDLPGYAWLNMPAKPLDVHLNNRATTGDNKTVRDSLHLPATSSVAVITSEGVCKKANRVYQAVLAGTGHGFSGQVYVIQIGTVHAVFDPVYHYGPLAGTFTVVVFDSRWRKLSMFNP